MRTTNWDSFRSSSVGALGAAKVYPPAGLLDKGISALIKLAAVGSIRLCGIMPLGNGCPVRGSLGQLAGVEAQSALKSAPAGFMSGRSAAVNTVGILLASSFR